MTRFCSSSLWTILLMLLASNAARAATLNDLYFGLDKMRNYAETYWWFLADGRVLRGLPGTGLTPSDFEAACHPDSSDCGTYVLSATKLSVKYRNGKAEDWTFGTLRGGIQLNDLILTPIKKFTAGTRLSGTFSRALSSTVANAPSSAVMVTVPAFFTFKADGTYDGRIVAGVSEVRGANSGGSSDSQTSGTYSVQDNVLVLIKNGKSERHMIFAAPGDNLNIDGQVYKKQQ